MGLSSGEIGACVGIVCLGNNGLSKKYQAMNCAEGGLGPVMSPSTRQKQTQVLLEETAFMFSLKNVHKEFYNNDTNTPPQFKEK